jgi:hypothetical protein
MLAQFTVQESLSLTACTTLDIQSRDLCRGMQFLNLFLRGEKL